MDAEAIREIERLVQAGQEINQLNAVEYGFFGGDGTFQTREYRLNRVGA